MRHNILLLLAVSVGVAALSPLGLTQEANTSLEQSYMISLQSADRSKRIVTNGILVDKIRKSNEAEKFALRNQLENSVREIMDAPVPSQEKWNDPNSARNLAVGIAGELKLESAIPRLIELLRPLDGQKFEDNVSSPNGELRTHEDVPIALAASALTAIGQAAERPLELALNESRASLRDPNISVKSKEYHLRLIKWSNVRHILHQLKSSK